YREFWANATDEVVALRPDVVHCHDTDTAAVGLRVLRRLGESECALVLDLHELYRESRMIPQRGAKGAFAKATVSRIERLAARTASLVIVANPGQAGLVTGVTADDTRIVVAENAPDTGRFAPSARERVADDPLRVCYIGQKRTADHLVDLMDAVGRTPRTHALIAGGGPAAEEVARAADMRERVDVVGRVDYEEIPALYSECDAVYAVYDTSVGNYRTHFPVKAMEAMAIGVPVIVSEGTWVASYVEEHGIGSAVREHDVDAIAGVLARWRDDPRSCGDMGRRGRELIQGGLNWETVSTRLVDAYAEAFGKGRSKGEG
ncbi:MAG: glycosyltransferase, partial [Coriobacteriia bacterium]|nr:glycosyltransferase [Coriobacteriia bacterium]